MTLILLTLDRDVAAHVAVAVRVHRSGLGKRGLYEPPALAELERAAHQIANSGQDRSTPVPDLAVSQHAAHEAQWLSPRDAAQLAAVSESTMRRWLRDGLPSSKHGQLRRISRVDLGRFMDGQQ